jgi:hypothetical protein
VGKVVQPLQSINCHDSRAHGQERHGPFTRLVGIWFGWDGSGWVQSVWFMVCNRCEACVHVLATGGMPVSVSCFWR